MSGFVRDVALNLPGGPGNVAAATGRVSVSPDVWYARALGYIGYGLTQAAAIVDVLQLRESDQLHP